MESQKETTVSLEEIEASSRELMELAQATAKTTGKKSNFKRQANALVRKHASFYKRSWTTLVVQIFIPILFMMGIYLFSLLITYGFLFNLQPYSELRAQRNSNSVMILIP